MILHRIEAACVGPFTGSPVVAGPFAPGLNILAAPNETGKTTLLKAASRALFDRHTCKDTQIYALQPAGTDLAPRVVVELETGAGRFRVSKTFLQSPASTLHEFVGGDWKEIAHGDDADNRLTRLLQSTQPGRGATKAAHWGLLGYLWMRQGEPAQWPEWAANPAGQFVQGLLVKVEIDPLIEAVRGRMWSAYLENFTPTGQHKAGGTLRETEEALARVDGALAKVHEERARLTADEEEFARLAGELPRLEAEHTEHRRAADELQEAARRAEVQAAEVQRRRHEFTTAQDRLRSIQQERDLLERHGRDLEESRRQLAGAEAEAGRSRQVAAGCASQLDQTERALEASDEELGGLQRAVTRAGKLVRHRQLQDGIERLARTLERCQKQGAHVESLVQSRADLPTITPARLRQWQTLDDAIRQRRAQIDALGLTVELTPSASADDLQVHADTDPAQTLPPLPAGETRTVRARRALDLELPGWGRVRMRSGAAETRTLEEVLQKDEETLRTDLAEIGAGTLDQTRTLAERSRELDAQIAAERQALAAMLDRDDTADHLRARLATERRQRQALVEELGGTPGIPPLSLAELEAAEQSAGVKYESRRTARESLQRQVKKTREAAAEAATAAERAGHAIVRLQTDAANLEKQAAAIRARYAGGLAAEADAAGFAYVEAKVTLQQAEEKLPQDAATLGDRNRRAAAAAAQVLGELERKRRLCDEIRGRLEWLGSQALYAREGDLLAERDALVLQAGHARARSRAARLVHDLIGRRKQAATRTVLGPLQDRLGAWFAEISGERGRQIHLDDTLGLRGLGRTPDEIVAFDDLSQGAKEQLLLCLRLAVAEELAASAGQGPQSLVLDDVLVNTDAARQRRILDVLAHAAAGGLQIVVCTCHPERYRGVGETVELRR